MDPKDLSCEDVNWLRTESSWWALIFAALNLRGFVTRVLARKKIPPLFMRLT
jgi:hypothetical protein